MTLKFDDFSLPPTEAVRDAFDEWAAFVGDITPEQAHVSPPFIYEKYSDAQNPSKIASAFVLAAQYETCCAIKYQREWQKLGHRLKETYGRTVAMYVLYHFRQYDIQEISPKKDSAASFQIKLFRDDYNLARTVSRLEHLRGRVVRGEAKAIDDFRAIASEVDRIGFVTYSFGMSKHFEDVVENIIQENIRFAEERGRLGEKKPPPPEAHPPPTLSGA